MAGKNPKDNSTLFLKVSLRRNLLKEIACPVVLETHGGYGRIYEKCYRDVADGVVFEKDAKKAAFLAQQRPEWAVYECDCEMALRAGAGRHLVINFVDLDPYGEPWPVLDAFLAGHGDRLPERWGLVVNDGLRLKVQRNGGWDVDSLRDAVAQYGAAKVYRNYLDVCRWLVEKKVTTAGFAVVKWAGYYCGANHGMTHYAAVLNRVSGVDGVAP